MWHAGRKGSKNSPLVNDPGGATVRLADFSIIEYTLADQVRPPPTERGSPDETYLHRQRLEQRPRQFSLASMTFGAGADLVALTLVPGQARDRTSVCNHQ